MAQEAAKGNSLVPVAGALFVGLLAGAAFFGNDGEIRKLKRDVEARIAAAESAVAGAAESATAGASAAATAAAEAAGAAAAERVAALEARLADAQAAFDAKLAETADAVAALAAPVAAETAPAAAAPVQAPAEAAPAAASPSGETELALSVGQTGVAGDLRIFMSRIDAAAAEAHVRVIGAGAATVGAHAGPATLGNGCTLSFAGIDGRTAKLVVGCP